MSTNTQCDIIEYKRAQWYLLLERYNEDDDGEQIEGATDAFGPFVSDGEALAYLDRNHANPGGYTVEPLPEGKEAASVGRYIESLIEAIGNKPASRPYC